MKKKNTNNSDALCHLSCPGGVGRLRLTKMRQISFYAGSNLLSSLSCSFWRKRKTVSLIVLSFNVLVQ